MSDRCNHGVWLGDLCYACERERNLAAEIDRLAAVLGETNEALAACQSQAGPLLVDAERYRWIRRHNKVGGKVTVELECDPPELCTCETGHKPHELDAAIDAAIKRATVTVAPDSAGEKP